MTVSAPHRIEPIMRMLADDIAKVQSMLLQYEVVTAPLIKDAPAHRKELQGFDLALQMLRDLEYLSRTVSEHVADELATSRPLHAPGLLLERSRHLLSALAEIQVDSLPNEPLKSIDLF